MAKCENPDCIVEITSNRKNVRYCSPKCRAAAYRLKTIKAAQAEEAPALICIGLQPLADGWQHADPSEWPGGIMKISALLESRIIPGYYKIEGIPTEGFKLVATVENWLKIGAEIIDPYQIDVSAIQSFETNPLKVWGIWYRDTTTQRGTVYLPGQDPTPNEQAQGRQRFPLGFSPEELPKVVTLPGGFQTDEIKPYTGAGDDMFIKVKYLDGTEQLMSWKEWQECEKEYRSKVIYENGFPSFIADNAANLPALVDNTIFTIDTSAPPRPPCPDYTGLKIGQRMAVQAEYDAALADWDQKYGEKKD